MAPVEHVILACAQPWIQSRWCAALPHIQTNRANSNRVHTLDLSMGS